MLTLVQSKNSAAIAYTVERDVRLCVAKNYELDAFAQRLKPLGY